MKNIYKIKSNSIMALVFGALLAVAPATATSITATFVTGPVQTSVGTGTFDYNYQNVMAGDIAQFNLSMTPQFFNTNDSLFNSFGILEVGTTAPTNGDVVKVNVTPTITVNGSAVTASTVLPFQGTIAVSGGVASINFGATANSTQVTVGGVQYTELSDTVNGQTADYAIQTVQQLTGSKEDTLYGFIVGVCPSVTPEPATLATTGLALMLVGFAARRKAGIKH